MKHHKAILAALPATLFTLTQRVGLDRSYIARHLRVMHADGLIHVGSHELAGNRGRAPAVFYAGPGVDAERPPPISRQEISRRQEARGRLRERPYEKPDHGPLVQQAIRRQPNSIFSLAGMAA